MGLSDWGLKSMVEKRLNKHLDYLLEDDKVRWRIVNIYMINDTRYSIVDFSRRCQQP